MTGDNLPKIPGDFGEPFSGLVRLFPLPNFVHFPSVVRALHIFEPRYCDMLEAALTSDRLITMATLQPGWECTYQYSPSIYSTVCIGRIIRHQPLPDGRHNILLQGVARAKIQAELEQVHSFRMAKVEVVPDIEQAQEGGPNARDLAESVNRIVMALNKNFPAIPITHLLEPPLLANIPIDAFSYLVASLLPISIDFQLNLLQEINPQRRLANLEAWIAQSSSQISTTGDGSNSFTNPSNATEPGKDFPPNFSLN